ncbi:MAG: type III pantothenate kinase [Myxococcota bacterium]
MLLVIDVGNSHTVLGVMKDGEVHQRWRISTIARSTDELGLLILQLLAHRGIAAADVDGVCLSCVVPSVLYAFEKASRRYLNQDALVVGAGTRTGMRVRTDNPREVGADRIVNAISAYARYNVAVVVVYFGTATTFDCVNDRGDYIGGAIAPGFHVSADALFARAAKLPKVEVERTAQVIGANTVAAMKAGLFWGYVGLVNELARRCKAELRAAEGTPRCIATGGMANLVGRACDEIEAVDEHLTLRGLQIIYERNRARSGRK